ncbi:Myotubularin [Gryllus bimaculatus]|nr:Myotubularin [Gryllus bimaculatus]
MEFADMILIPKLDGVVLHGPFQKPVDGTLCITGHHLILSSRKEGGEELWLMHHNVDSIERKPNGALGGSLIIKCKDFRIIQLDINSTDEFMKVATSIERLSSLGVEEALVIMCMHVCPTYPSTVVVPRCVDDETIMAAAAFREGGRFPVLSYRHEGGSVLLRSSQPLTGPSGRRCKDDERLINSVLGPGKRGYIIDTRTQALAQAAKSRGGGFETEVHYPQWRRVNKPIDRHSVLLDSLAKLMDACNDTSASMDRWLSRLEACNWMSHIKDTLNCACLVAQCLDQEGASVLVHGSEGTDATLLVTSLAQVILNPDCRTVRGLEALVEREWLQAGHPFPVRHARSCYASSGSRGKAQAPTFLLFLDCVNQIHQQFPCSFEFSTHLLILLFEHSYSSQFGTFQGTCEADRVRLQLAQKTVSLWSHLNRPDVLQSFLNPMYDPNNRVIWPSVAPMSLTLWSELFLRWVVDQSPQRQAWRTITALRERDKELRLKATRLRRQLAELEREAVEAGVLAPAAVLPASPTPGADLLPAPVPAEVA